MTALENFIQSNRLSEVDVMNQLQGHGGIISDCCVWAKDVPATDAVKAVAWLKKEKLKQDGNLL